MNRVPFSRRGFLQLGSMGLISTALPFPGNYLTCSGKWNPAKLSVQLYTVREAFKTDIPGSLRKIRDIGFNYVETAFWPENISLKTAAGYLKDAGLSVSSSHIELPVTDALKQNMLDAASAYGTKRMIWHGWPEDKRYSSLEGTLELITIYNASAQFASEHGLQFGLHNHWWEYRNKVAGRYVYEILAEKLDPRIFFETDTYWVKVAGQDPAAIVKKLGSRIQMLHIKDGPARWNDGLANDNPDPMTAVGQGTQNFPAIVKAADGNVEWLVVEMDKVSGNVFEALQQSYIYLLDNKMVTAS